MEEEKWLEQAIKGDIPAFEALIRAYEGRIYHIALKALGNAEDAGDATQETLLKIYRFLPDFKGQSRFSTWVYRIAVNTCYDFLRQKRDYFIIIALKKIFSFPLFAKQKHSGNKKIITVLTAEFCAAKLIFHHL